LQVPNPKLTVDDITGIVGIIPTPSTLTADQWNAENTVDLDEAAKLADAMVRGDVDVLMTTGTFGECASLTWDEQQDFVDAVVETVAGRIPVFAGATTLNTRDTIARGRRLTEIGADGLFVGRPMWLPLDDAGIVRFYREMAEALPDVPLVVYDNPGAFKGKIGPSAYEALSRIPQIVAAKHLGLLSGAAFLSDLRAVDGRMRLLPLETDWYYFARLFPDEVTACWSGNVACGPAPATHLRDLIKAQSWGECQALTEELDRALEPLYPGGNFPEFLKYSIQLDNAQFQGASFMRTGPTRPPYTEVPEAYLEGAREAGRRWARLHQRYEALRSAQDSVAG
jgi:4-(2-carboxyphenyl)-2-oxobut-3-enoate aldolase